MYGAGDEPLSKNGAGIIDLMISVTKDKTKQRISKLQAEKSEE